jgi:hypothetical protein
VWDYVYRDGKALCAYYTCWTVGHLDRGLKFLPNIGD